MRRFPETPDLRNPDHVTLPYPSLHEEFLVEYDCSQGRYYLKLGQTPRYCPFCGDEIVTEGDR